MQPLQLNGPVRVQSMITVMHLHPTMALDMATSTGFEPRAAMQPGGDRPIMEGKLKIIATIRNLFQYASLPASRRFIFLIRGQEQLVSGKEARDDSVSQWYIW